MLRCLALTALAVLVLTGIPARAQDAAPNTLTQDESRQGWLLLFDGKSLDGWEARTTSDPDASPDWIVRDGALLCGGTTPSWLGTVDAYGNYILRLEFRGPAGVNSGVFLRSQKEGAPHLTGYELQIWDEQPDRYNTGSLVGVVRAPPAKMIPDQWNRYEVTTDGDHLVAVLNGKKVLDVRNSAHASGVVGLQCQVDNRIEFRNIKLLPQR